MKKLDGGGGAGGGGAFYLVEIFHLVGIASLLHVIVMLEEKSYWKQLIFDLIN